MTSVLSQVNGRKTLITLPESGGGSAYLYTDAVFVSKNIAVSGDGSVSSPFKTIQEAVNYFGIPISAADYQRRCCIYVLDSGTYTENLIIPHRNITIFGNGLKISGNITREIDDNLEFGISSSAMRARFALIGLGRTSRDTHTGYISGILLTGSYSEQIRTGGIGFTTHDTYFECVRIEGTLNYNSSVGQSVHYFQGCRIVGQVNGTGILFLQRASDTRFDSGFAAVTFVNVENCQFNGTALSTAGFTYEQGLRDVQFAAGTVFTVNSAGQTVYANAVTNKQLSNVTFAVNTPAVSRIDV